jgi:hypothetical protein
VVAEKPKPSSADQPETAQQADKPASGLTADELVFEKTGPGKTSPRKTSPNVDSPESRHGNVHVMPETTTTQDPDKADSGFGDVESIASSVTDRMVSRDQSKWWKKRSVQIGLASALFLISFATVIWIVVKYVVPVLFM